MQAVGQQVRLFIAEEQPFLREAYESLLRTSPVIDVVGTAASLEPRTLSAAAALGPEVIMVGTQFLTEETIERLGELRRSAPGAGFVLLSFGYNARAVSALREFSKRAVTGCAYLLKHTVGSVEQLEQVVVSVAEGRIIIDPEILDELVRTPEPRPEFLHRMSPRENEVLGWMARGYRNDAIAGLLHLERKTVERHINNIYAKLDCPASKHPRVQAIQKFLAAAGYRPLNGVGSDEPFAVYDGARSMPAFQPSAAQRSAMDGSRSLAGASHAIPAGTATFSMKRPNGRS